MSNTTGPELESVEQADNAFLQASETARQARINNRKNSVRGNTHEEATEGALADELRPSGQGGSMNVVKNFRWTLTDLQDTSEVPYVRLVEYKCNESAILRQLSFYSNVLPETIRNSTGGKAPVAETLSVYDELWPHDGHESGFVYTLPYFNTVGYELRTTQWKALDSVGDSLKSMATGASQIASSLGMEGAAKGIDTLASLGGAAGAASNTMMNSMYPSVGITDRPKVFAGHEDRQITISFPLYNTLYVGDWEHNLDLIKTLMNQNLYNKRDYITGVPPHYYSVKVPGQYFCWAAAMTDIKVEYLGNQRLLDGTNIVPDAYQVTLTLSELVSPSRNQFDAIDTGAADSYVGTGGPKNIMGALGNMTSRGKNEVASAAKRGLASLLP